nr:flippase-like domain-containing protein [Deltaproteobacteria bacterium]
IGLLRSLVLYILAISLNIYVSFGLIVACRALIGIANVIPVTISGLGTRDAILLLTLPLAGISKEAALALGLIAFLWTIGSKFSGVLFWLQRPLPAGSIMAIKEKLFT